MTGIYVGDRWVQKLSGPTSLHWLQPLDPKMPYVMLIGDRHFSFAGSCPTCTCWWSMESCCYRSFDPEFLRLIDSLSTPEKKIKIFVETFTRLALTMTPTDEILNKVFPHVRDEVLVKQRRYFQQLPEIFTKFQSCFYRLGDTTAYNRHCPTKNIEWHFADARGRSDVDRVYKPPAISSSKGVVYKYDFEYTVFQLCLGLAKSFQEASQYKRDAKHAPHFEFVQEVIKMILKKPNRVLPILFSRKDSLVNKEMQRFSASGPSEKYLKTVIGQFFQYLADTISSDANLEVLEGFLKGSFKKHTSDKAIDDAFLSLVQLTSGFLDVYFVFRSLKMQDSWLNILYAGESHCKNISHLLTKICGWYELSGEVATDNRCLDLASLKIEFNAIGKFPSIVKHKTGYKTLHEDLDKIRKSMLDPASYDILYVDHQMPTDDDLQNTMAMLNRETSLEDLKTQLRLHELVDEFQSRSSLKDAADEKSALTPVEKLCDATSNYTKLTEADINEFFKLGWWDVLTSIVHCSYKLAPYVISQCIKKNKPDQAMQFFELFNANFFPSSVANMDHISTVIGLMKLESMGKQLFRYKMLDVYKPMLEKFRGTFDHPDDIDYLIKHHADFRKAWNDGDFRNTLTN